MGLAGIPPWNDQDVLLYHGTSDLGAASVLRAVDLKQARSLTDFGPGFYTTTRLDQAWRWARAVARTRGGTAAVIEFVVGRQALAQLECLFFVRGHPHAVDFWSFVQSCRTGLGDHGRKCRAGCYDVVAGPVPGDWRKQTLIPDGDQVSFHTRAAVDVLNQLPARAKGVVP